MAMKIVAMESPAEAAEKPWLHILLFEPEIAFNTGAIGRTCQAVGAKLWLVRPLGFRLDEKNLRRAGMDYWKSLDVTVVDSYEEAIGRTGSDRIFLLTTKGSASIWDPDFEPGDVLVFGPESRGLPHWILDTQPPERRLRIPMRDAARSLNLANAASVAMYEAARQIRPGCIASERRTTSARKEMP